MSRFGNTALDIVSYLARRRAREIATDLADRARSLFPGVDVAQGDQQVTLSAKGLRGRLLRDAKLRRPAFWRV